MVVSGSSGGMCAEKGKQFACYLRWFLAGSAARVARLAFGDSASEQKTATLFVACFTSCSSPALPGPRPVSKDLPVIAPPHKKARLYCKRCRLTSCFFPSLKLDATSRAV